MTLNKIFKLFYINTMFLIIIFLLENCTSRSAQANLSQQKSNKNSSIIVKNENRSSEIGTNLVFYPTSTTGQIIKHSYYLASYIEKDEQSEWVAYKVTSSNFNKNIKRTNDYREDPSIKTESGSPDDYHGNGYDMGHLAPAHAMAYNYTSMSESFYLSNISPQKASFNRGIWRSLESKVEYWSSFKDSIYVVTGPILDNPIDHIGENEITVPRAFYKTLVSFKDGKTKGIAFMIPNEKSTKSIFSYVTSIDEVEKMTNIDFYHEIESTSQQKIESNESIKVFISN